MRHLSSGIRQRMQRMSLSQRLILSLVLLVIATVVFSGLPANIAIWRALEQQVWLRVEAAQSATHGLYNAEITRIKKVAGLIAGRPTLYALIQQADTTALEPYLQSLRQEVDDLDIVQVHTPDMVIGDQLAGLPSPAEFLAGHEPYFADFLNLGNPARIFLVGVSQVPYAEPGVPTIGWVLVARELKDDDMLTLEKETGLA